MTTEIVALAYFAHLAAIALCVSIGIHVWPFTRIQPHHSTASRATEE